ncbi:MAG: hypothetical protein ACKVPY_16250 [Paracoccaceae bacterium]
MGSFDRDRMMTRPLDLHDAEGLTEWVQWRTPHEAVLITQRAVCRVLPLFGSAMLDPWADANNLSVLPLLRLDISGVATGRARPLDRLPAPNPDSGAIKALSLAAKKAERNDLAIVADATLGAADVAYGARSDAIKLRGDVGSIVHVCAGACGDAESFWTQVASDAVALESGHDLHAIPLWSQPVPSWFLAVEGPMRAIWSQAPARWSFWTRWWDGVLSGRQLDWRLQEAVALIPGDVWKAGPDAVAEAIRDIEENLWSDVGTQRTIHGSLDRNRKAIQFQFDALLAFVESEVEQLRGQNSFSTGELERRDARIAALRTITDAVMLMRAAIAEEPSESTALAVVDAQLPAVITAAETAVAKGGPPELSEVIVTMSVTIKHLTDSGTPGTIATGIAFADLCWRKIQGWRKKR